MQASAALRAAVGAALRRAQDAGAVQREVTVDELYLLIRGLSQAGAARPVPESTLRGALAVVLAGLGLTRPVS
jgi:hypothetical protein